VPKNIFILSSKLKKAPEIFQFFSLKNAYKISFTQKVEQKIHPSFFGKSKD